VVTRKLVHTRKVETQVFRRDDGLWDIEASLADVRTEDSSLPSGVRRGGDAMHNMVLSITIDLAFNVLSASARSLSTPYPEHCPQAASGYDRLVGLNLVNGFRRAVKERVGGIEGCTHITELSQFLPTAAIQAVAGEADTFATIKAALNHGEPSADDTADKHFQIDRCHALRSSGPAVQLYFPTWFKPLRTPLP
jgi:Protein of unknown function (DUF2889)